MTLELKFLIDTTGAGDQFAAGFLYGMSSNCDLETSYRWVNLQEVGGHIGPRPKVSVRIYLFSHNLSQGLLTVV